MRSLAIIPARGGSKRIPGKNLVSVGGKSLLVRAWESAAPCGNLSRIVSTDDHSIKRHLWDHGGSGCIFTHIRKPEHAGDDSQIEDFVGDLLHDMEWDDESDKQVRQFDVLVILQPTSPFRTAAHVSAALALLTPGVDSVVSVTQDPGYRFMGRLTTDGLSYRPYRPDLGERGRSTDSLDHRCPVRENGAIYVTRREAFERSGLRMSGVMRGYLMSVRDSFEIDEPWELEAARAIAGCV